MNKQTMLLIACIFSSSISFTSDPNKDVPQVEFIAHFDDIPWVESYPASEIDNDSFCVSVISFVDPTDTEILDIKD